MVESSAESSIEVSVGGVSLGRFVIGSSAETLVESPAETSVRPVGSLVGSSVEPSSTIHVDKSGASVKSDRFIKFVKSVQLEIEVMLERSVPFIRVGS